MRRWHFTSLSEVAVALLCIDWVLRDLPATFSEAMATRVHFWSINGTFRPPQVQCWQLPAAFSAVVVPSINFPCIDETLQQLLVRGGNCRLLPEHQQSFRQLSVHPLVRPSTFRASEGPSVTFLASVGPSVNIRQISALPRDLLQLSMQPWDLPSTSCVDVGLSVNFCQLFLHSRDIPSTSRVPTGLSVKLHQLSV